MFQALSIMLSRSRRSKFVQIPNVWLTHIDKVRGSNNQAPWATLKMTEVGCCFNLYQCYLCAEHSSFWVYQSLSSPKIRNVEDSSFVSSPFDYASRSRWSKFVRIPNVRLTHVDEVRGSNNQVPRAMEKMTELVWCINLYQWCYLCANTVHFETISNKVCRRKGTWKNHLLFQAHSKLL